MEKYKNKNTTKEYNNPTNSIVIMPMNMKEFIGLWPVCY